MGFEAARQDKNKALEDGKSRLKDFFKGHQLINDLEEILDNA